MNATGSSSTLRGKAHTRWWNPTSWPDRPRDLGHIAALSAVYALVLAALYLLKPARNALFLAHLGIESLPYVLLLVALIGGPAASLYARVSVAVDIRTLLLRTFVALAGVLVVFRLLLESKAGWVYYAFYIVVALFGLLATSLTWLFANAVFDAHRARRVFGIIGSGGIAGAILGGLFTGRAASLLGTENLLFVSASLLIICPMILHYVPTSETTRRRGAEAHSADQSTRAVLRTPLARNLAALTALIAFVAVVVDVQFNELVDRAYSDQDQKTAFFGDFFAYLSAVSLAFQLFITPMLLRALGAGIAAGILPFAVGLGSLGILLTPSLLAGAIAKGADGGFRHSVHKAAHEVLFLPVPEEIKRRAKLFLDTTVDTSATGLAAVSVLVLTSGLGVSHSGLSFLSLGLLIAVIWFVVKTRRSYVDAFRQALDRRTIGLDDLRTSLAEAQALQTLLPALQGENERQVCYALDLLSAIPSAKVSAAVMPLVDHPSATVRTGALAALEAQKQSPPRERIEALLDDPIANVRQAAMRVMVRKAGPKAPEILERQLSHDRPTRVTAALSCLPLVKSKVRTALLTSDRVDQLWTRAAERRELKMAITTALAGVDSEDLSNHFDELCQDPDPELRHAAIEGVRQFNRTDRAQWVVGQLADRRTRVAARSALAELGASAQEPLATALANADIPVEVRQTIPRVLTQGFGVRGAAILAAHLRHPHPVLRRAVLRAAHRIRTRDPRISFDGKLVHAAIAGEIANYELRLNLVRSCAHNREPTTSERLLIRALTEKKQEAKDNTFLLLSLCHDPKDVANALAGLASRQQRIRATALELLDNILERRLRDPVLRMVDPTRAEDGTAALTPAEAIRSLIQNPDPWLRACALFAFSPERDEELRPILSSARTDPDPVVRDTAERRLVLLSACEP